MTYTSTRNTAHQATASQAILNGIAPDGGLYVLNHLPHLPQDTLHQLIGASYQQVAKTVLPLFLDDFTQEEIDYCVDMAYNQNNFRTETMIHIKSIDHHHYLELFHGKTFAFKDMALSILPYFMQVAAKKNQLTNKLVILTATSGDTGKAALEAFCNVDGIEIFVFYPKQGVSAIQEKQMVTQIGHNVHVFGVKGNFDDAQTQVKQLFNDDALKETLRTKGYQFTSANSINIGRLIPQIVYYVYAYTQLIAQQKLTFGQRVHVAVPTGNFGNILAAYYAKTLGLPIETLLCASNENNVLSEFFQTGTYNKKRPFIITNSPSMDILISSNLERLIYHETNNNATQTNQLMTQLNDSGEYSIEFNRVLNDFIADSITQYETLSHIREIFNQHDYVIDTHTAVASAFVSRYEDITQDKTPVLIASTASPYKFPENVLNALLPEGQHVDEWTALDSLSTYTHSTLPNSLNDLRYTPIRFDNVIAVDDMANVVLSHLKG